MKKIIVFLLLTIIFCFSFCTCNNNTDTSKSESIEEKVKYDVDNTIHTEFIWGYGDLNLRYITHYVNTISENTFKVSGKITTIDNYGDFYTGKYDAIVKYNSDEDKFDTTVNIGTFYMDRDR